MCRLRNYVIICQVASVQSRALQKAAELIGGRKKLAQRLGVTAAEIEKWTGGSEETPRDVFLRAVDLLLDELTPAPGDSAKSDESPPTRSSAGSSQRDFD